MEAKKGIALLTAVVMTLLISVAVGTLLIVNSQHMEIASGVKEHKVTLYLNETAAIIARDHLSTGTLLPNPTDPGATFSFVAILDSAPSPPFELDVVASVGGSEALLGDVSISDMGQTFPNSRDITVIIERDPELNPAIQDYL